MCLCRIPVFFLDQSEVPAWKLLLQHLVGFHSFRKVDRDGAKLSVRHGQSSSECRGRRSVVLRDYPRATPEWSRAKSTEDRYQLTQWLI